MEQISIEEKIVQYPFVRIAKHVYFFPSTRPSSHR